MKKEEIIKHIKETIKLEMTILIDKISGDFSNNFERKIHNWTLAKFSDTLVAHMVFVSSFESKSGNMFQKIAREIAEIRYGEQNIPKVLKGRGISDEEFESFKQSYDGDEQVVATKVNQSSCQNIVAKFRESHRVQGRGRSRISPTLNQDRIKDINKENFDMNGLITKPIDLVIYDNSNDTYYIMEIKAGGDLDSSNAPGNIAKMLTEFLSFGKDNVKLYFATLYNKNGEGNTWTGFVKQYLSDDMLLIGSDFWRLVLPEDISFEDFKNIYNEVSNELNINQIIDELIKNSKR